MRWNYDEIIRRAGPWPHDVRALFREFGYEPPTPRMLDNWRRREQIPHATLPVVLKMLEKKGRLERVTEVIK